MDSCVRTPLGILLSMAESCSSVQSKAWENLSLTVSPECCMSLLPIPPGWCEFCFLFRGLHPVQAKGPSLMSFWASESQGGSLSSVCQDSASELEKIVCHFGRLKLCSAL